MIGKKATNKKIARKAGRILGNFFASDEEKSVAASVLAQCKKHYEKITSNQVAKKASLLLKNQCSTNEVKSVAGSALVQKEK